MYSLDGETNFENARPSRFCMKQLLKDLQTSHSKIKLGPESTHQRTKTSKPKQRRTSTPTRQVECGAEDKRYKKFEERLEKPMSKSAIRGAEFAEGSFISGHFPFEARERSHTFVMVFPHSFHTLDYEKGEEQKLVVEVCVPPPVPMLCYYNHFYYAYCYPVV